MDMSFHRFPPDGSAERLLVPLLEAAVADGRAAWYVAMAPGVGDRRVNALARRTALLDPPVGTLDDLVHRALRRARRRTPERLDDPLVELLVRRAVADAVPDAVAGPGLERAARDAIDELRLDGWTRERFEAALDRMSTDGAPRRLARIWASLDRSCPEADPATPLRVALEDQLLEREPPDLLLIEGGPLRGELHARLLARLVDTVRRTHGEVVAAFADSPADGGPYDRGRTFVRRLLNADRGRSGAGSEAGAEDRGADVVQGVADAPAGSAPPAAPALRRLARNLFRESEAATDDAESHAASEVVLRLRAPDARATADLVAREIRALLDEAESPETLLDAGVLVVHPTPDDADMIERALRRLDIPVRATPREPMAAHPGGRHLLRLLDVLEQGERTSLETVLALLESVGWNDGVHMSEADALARYLQLRGAVRVGDALELLRDREDGAAVRTRRGLRRLVGLAERVRGAETAAERGELILGMLHRRLAADEEEWVGDPRRPPWKAFGPSALLAGHALTPEVRATSGYARPLRRLDDLLAALAESVRRTGDEISFDDWLRSLRTLIEENEVRVGSGPARGVRLERPGPRPTEPAEIVFVVGLVERRFPRAARQNPFLSDRLRERIANGALLGPRLAIDTPAAERERFHFACAAARRRLYLCHPRTDADGREVLPSFFVEDAARALGLEGARALPEIRRRMDEVVPAPERCVDRAELRAAIAAAIRDEDLDDDAGIEVRRAYDGLAAADPTFTTAVIGRFPDWRAAVRDDEVRDWLRVRAERLSASQLEFYGHCAFRHFVDRRLDPEPVRVPELDARFRGSAVHRWLWDFGVELDGWTNPDAALDVLARRGPPAARPSVFASNRSIADWTAWQSRLGEFLRAECERLAAGDFRPEFHELGFGHRRERRDPRSLDEPVALELDGRTVAFSGSIDRVDTWRDGDALWGIAVDYKTGGVDRFRAELEDGHEVQLPLYLLVLEAAFGVRPGGALYASVKDDTLVGVIRAELADRAGPLGGKVIVANEDEWTALRERAVRSIVERYEGMRAPRIGARPRNWDCGFCDFQAVCRIDLWRAKRHD